MRSYKKWNIKQSSPLKSKELNDFADALGVLPVIALLLYNREIRDTESALKFLKKDAELFHDPYLLKDMVKAIERIMHAVDNREKIVIYGDYDVDGVTAVSILYLYLKEKNADVDYYIPNRSGEGYGINQAAIYNFSKLDVKLIITVDTGITAYTETEYINSLGIDIVITDHHECYLNMPNAIAVVNPKQNDCTYPFKDLAGVGVVFKLLCAMESEYYKREGITDKDYVKEICNRYGDIVAIGTVADVMPLIGENRLMVNLGLKLLEKSTRPGLTALLEQSGSAESKTMKNTKKKKITSSYIGYVIAPRINAAGRISNASKAVELFLTESHEQARQIASELCDTNKERQNEENAIIEEAYKKIEKEHDFNEDLVIVLAEDNWHHGVIGIVASRITEHYGLPSVLISFEENNIGKGSGRSIKGMNLADTLMYCREYLIKYGGHELAAGLSIEKDNLPAFKKKINEYARKHLKEEDLITSVAIDCELEAEDITIELINQLYWLEPYGISNAVPVFLLKDVKIKEIISIGNNRHTKIIFEKDSKLFNAVYFGISAEHLDFYTGDYADVVFNLDINDFQNYQSVQILIRDIAHSKNYLDTLGEQRKIYNEIKEGRKISKDEKFIPTREDFIAVYQYIKQEVRQGRDILNIHNLEHIMGGSNNEYYIKIRFIIDILNETNIIGVEKHTVEDVYKFKINYVKTKICLEKSSIYKKIKSKQEKS